MEQVSTRNTAPRDCLRTSLKHEQSSLHFGGTTTPWASPFKPSSLHLTSLFLKLTWNEKLTVQIFATQCHWVYTFLHFFLNNRYGILELPHLYTHVAWGTQKHKEVISEHSTSRFTQILREIYSPFCFWCVKETGSREKWQQHSHCGRVIRKESRLTHRGGAVVNKHTSKCRPTPLVPGVTQS